MAFDGVLSNKWQISAYPTIFIIDDKGVLRVITHELSSEKLNALFNRDKDNFAKSLYKEHYQNDIKKLYFVNNNGANDTTFLFRSILAKSTLEHSRNGIADLNSSNPKFVSTSNLKIGLFQLSGVSLMDLYNVAYFGQSRLWWSDSLYKTHQFFSSYSRGNILPFLETRDSSDFFYDFKTFDGLYTYSLSVPKEKASRDFIMKCIRLDLQKYFHYDAKIEIRLRPIWRLVVIDKSAVEKLRVKASEDPSHSKPLEYSAYKNVPVTTLTGILSQLMSKNYDKAVTFFDETGIDYNLNLKLTSNLRDLESVKHELTKSGLDLIKGEREMKVLMISDSK
ncbi:hypothetical protein D3C87_1224680 [compost metagenome]